MQKECVTLEIAKKLKEIGFDEPCIAGYNSYNILKHNIAIVCGDEHDYISISRHDNKLLAPTWQQAIRWLDSKNIFIDIVYHKSGKFAVSILNECDLPITNVLSFELYKSRSKAQEVAILEALKHVKQQ